MLDYNCKSKEVNECRGEELDWTVRTVVPAKP